MNLQRGPSLLSRFSALTFKNACNDTDFFKKTYLVVEMNLWMVKLNDPTCINRVILGCFS